MSFINNDKLICPDWRTRIAIPSADSACVHRGGWSMYVENIRGMMRPLALFASVAFHLTPRASHDVGVTSTNSVAIVVFPVFPADHPCRETR